jgi:hypothetical protein
MIKLLWRYIGGAIVGALLAVLIVAIIMIVAITYQKPEFQTLSGRAVTSEALR